MLTIAGGIILAILFLVFLEPIVKLAGSLFVISVVVIAIVISIYFAINNFEIAAIFIPISIAIFYVYKKKERKKIINNEIEKEDKKKVNELFEQLELRDKLNDLLKVAGELLLSSSNDESLNRVKTITLEHYTFILMFTYDESRFSLKFIKNLNYEKLPSKINHFKNIELDKEFEHFSLFRYLPENLSIDDVFNLNSDLENYHKNALKQEIEKSKKSTIDGNNYFEDAKNIYKNNNTIYIFQHLISENGIRIYTPVQCKEKIEATVVFDFFNLNVKIAVENNEVALIEIKKWNELRKNKIIKFKSEYIES